MKDGHTRAIKRSDVSGALFLARHRVSLVIVEGPAAGTEFELNSESVVVGRGEDADLVLADDAMSGSHARIELGAEGFLIRDLGSTNGTLLNGSPVVLSELKHGDRISLGEHTLQYVLEKKERGGSYDLSDEF